MKVTMRKILFFIPLLLGLGCGNVVNDDNTAATCKVNLDCPLGLIKDWQCGYNTCIDGQCIRQIVTPGTHCTLQFNDAGEPSAFGQCSSSGECQ